MRLSDQVGTWRPLDVRLSSTLFSKNINLIPKYLRALIVGKSSSVKSTLLYNFLLKPWLDYNNLIAFGNSLHQSEHQIIKPVLNTVLVKNKLLMFLVIKSSF